MCRFRNPGRFRDDIAGRIASADNEHTFSGKLFGRFKVFRMYILAGKLAGIFWKPLVPMVAIADKHTFIDALVAICQLYIPKLVRPRPDRCHLYIELDPRPQIESVGVKLVIIAHLLLARKIGVIGRHRKIGKFGRPA